MSVSYIKDFDKVESERKALSKTIAVSLSFLEAPTLPELLANLTKLVTDTLPKHELDIIKVEFGTESDYDEAAAPQLFITYAYLETERQARDRLIGAAATALRAERNERAMLAELQTKYPTEEDCP